MRSEHLTKTQNQILEDFEHLAIHYKTKYSNSQYLNWNISKILDKARTALQNIEGDLQQEEEEQGEKEGDTLRLLSLTY